MTSPSESKPARRRGVNLALLVLALLVGVGLLWIAFASYLSYRQHNAVRGLGADLEHIGYASKHPYLPQWLRAVMIDQPVRLKANCGDAELENLRKLPRLQALELTGSDVTDAGMVHVGELRHLQYLIADHHAGITDEGVSQLAPLSDLRLLSLTGTNVTNASLELLPNWPKLGTLSVAKTRVTDEGLARLGRSDVGGLSLFGTAVSDHGLPHLRPLTRLAALNLGQTRISNEGLLEVSKFTELRVLYLGENDISDDGVEHLVGLAKLRSLDLSDTNISGNCLSKLTTLKDLRSLNLDGTQITDEGLVHLANFPETVDIRVLRTRLTPQAVHEFRREYPKVRIGGPLGTGKL